MTLRSHLDLAALGVTAGSGCWGYTSPAGRRLALVGTSAGLSVVDVTNPASARVTGAIAGAASAWREVRTYREFAYVTTEAQTGLDIVDLRDPDRPARVRTWSDTFASAHSLWIDEENGDVLSVIAFDRIKGGKPFDITQDWYLELLEEIGQPAPVAAPPAEH